MKLEKLFYTTYVKLNKRRKAKEAVPALFKLLDDIRRRAGFIR